MPEDEARLAINGDRRALDRLIRALQGDLYGVALRMLCNREDAEDATQEILVRIITHLSQFDFRSKLKTWAYRIAVNYILDVKKSRVERLNLSFEKFAEGLTSELSLSAPSERGSFASAPSSFQETRAKVRQVEEARWALEVHRTSHPRASPVDFARRLVETLDLD